MKQVIGCGSISAQTTHGSVPNLHFPGRTFSLNTGIMRMFKTQISRWNHHKHSLLYTLICYLGTGHLRKLLSQPAAKAGNNCQSADPNCTYVVFNNRLHTAFVHIYSKKHCASENMQLQRTLIPYIVCGGGYLPGSCQQEEIFGLLLY